MSGKRHATSRDAQRRRLGQNFLTDPAEISRLVDAVGIGADDLVVEIGAGRGALTLPLASTGARVLAIERDPVWATKLRESLEDSRDGERVEVVEADFRDVPLPTEPYRVFSSPPFGLSTTLLAHLLDEPDRGPWRADLLLQLEVARKRASSPPSTLRSSAWAPWWAFRLGPRVNRTAFRPVPKVDTAVLIVERRDLEILPTWLGPAMRELLRPGWDPPR